MTNKQFKVKFLKRQLHFSLKQMAIFALIFGAIGGYILFRTFAAAPVVGSIEAENMLDSSSSTLSGGLPDTAGGTIIGETTVLPQSDYNNGNLLVAQSAKLTQISTLQSLSFYVTTPAGKLRLGVYDANGPNGGPGAKKVETAEITATSGWNTARVTTPVTLTPGTYWLAYLPSDNRLTFRKAQDSSSSGRYYHYSYGTLPAAFSTTPNSTASHWSFYATLNGSVPILGASTNHSIDGNLADWTDGNISIPIAKNVIGAPNNRGSWGALWDNQYLYVAAKVLDSSLKKDSDKIWQDDSVEVYVDPDANGGTVYDSNDRQFSVGWNNSSLGGISANTPGVLHAWAPIEGGYSVELAIPWSNLGVSPSSGKAVKLDVGYNDDDNGGDRDSQAMWSGTSYDYRNPSGFGLATLLDSALTLPPQSSQPAPIPTIKVVDDTTASNGKAMLILRNTTINGQFTNSIAATSLSIVAKGTTCGGASPNMVVKVDGNQILSPNVEATNWNNYSANVNLVAGTHNLSISFTNDYVDASCDRNLYIDKADFIGTNSPPPPAPTVSLSASPTSITSGSSSTLTWSSTNATSCTASSAWSGSKPLNGSASTGALNTTSTYNLTCSSSAGSASASATVTVTSTSPPPPPPPPPSTSGWPRYGVSPGYTILNRSSTMQDWELDRMKEIGAETVRLDYAEPAKADVTIAKAINKGIQPEVAFGGTMKYPTSLSVSSFASRCSSGATKWKGKVHFWEIMNEPDLNGWTADTYVPYQRACYQAVKAVDPAAVVLHAGMWDGNVSTTLLIDWVAREYALGAKNNFDVFNFHCYGDLNQHGSWSIWDMVYGSGGSGYYDNYNVRSVMNQNGDSAKPIVCTEGGENANAHGTTAQANDVTYSLQSVDGVGTGYRKTKMMYIYDMLDTVSGFGMMYPTSSGSVIAPDGSHWGKRPSWSSYYNFRH